MKSVEDKWINNQLAFDTYQRWHTDLFQKIMSLNAQIDSISQNQKNVWITLQDELDKLKDIQYLYNKTNVFQKQQLIILGFDSKLYYKDGAYLTPYIIPMLSHNELKM